MNAEEEGRVSPVSAGLADDLARLHGIALDGGVPGELFLGVAAAPVAVPPTAPWPEDALGAAGRRDPGSVPGLAARIRAGGLPVVEVVAGACERIRTGDDEVRAWVRTDPRALDEARRLDDEQGRGAWRGPLHGIPIGVKDIVDVAGLPTAAGSRQWSGPGRVRIPGTDAASVRLLRAAGAVVVGKTTTHEFAFGGTTPPTRNPHDRARIPGGSSGGSAAAVAAGHVRIAVGTDTAGSVRIPSSYCGTLGLVPSVGRLPCEGVAPLAWSLDRVGLITADVADLGWTTAALGVTAAPPQPGEAVARLAGLRVGVPRNTLGEPLAPAVAAAFEAVVGTLREAGAVVGTVEIEHAWAAVAAGVVLFLAESMDYHRDRWLRTPELFGADVRATLELAGQVSGADYVRAQRVRRALRAEALAALAGVDLLLTPTMPSAAPPVEQAAAGVVVVDGREVSLAEAHLRFNVLANLAALPAGTQPMGRDCDGLPLGVQWVGPPGGDDRLLAAMTGLSALLRSAVGSQR